MRSKTTVLRNEVGVTGGKRRHCVGPNKSGVPETWLRRETVEGNPRPPNRKKIEDERLDGLTSYSRSFRLRNRTNRDIRTRNLTQTVYQPRTIHKYSPCLFIMTRTLIHYSRHPTRFLPSLGCPKEDSQTTPTSHFSPPSSDFN